MEVDLFPFLGRLKRNDVNYDKNRAKNCELLSGRMHGSFQKFLTKILVEVL